jgi:DNA primase
VRLSSPDKVYFPETGVTKGQLAEFFVGAADVVLNHLHERPTMLKRYAGGIEESIPTSCASTSTRCPRRRGTACAASR